MTADTDIDAAAAAPDVVAVLTTLPAEADAAAFAETLVTERLAACVSIGAPMISVYVWNGAVERASERQLFLKTVRAKVPAIKARLAALHPYDVPELLVVPVIGGGDAYLEWVRESTAG